MTLFSRRFWTSLSHRMRVVLAVAAVAALAGAAWAAVAVRDYRIEATLLRADPDSLPGDSQAMRLASASGANAFRSNCAACHGEKGFGDPSLGVPNLADADWLYGTGRVSEIQQTVKYGIRAQDPRGWNQAEMPAFAHPVPYEREKLLPLSPADVADVVQYLFRQEKRPADAEAAARGQKIFQSRGACWDCHGDQGQGDNAVGAPNLTDNIWLFGDSGADDIASVIEDGRQGVCPAWVGRLSPAEILEVSLYVYSLSHPVREAAR